MQSNVAYDYENSRFLGKIWFYSSPVLQHNMVSTNQNAGLFGHQHIWVELMDILDFCAEIIIKER